MDRHSARRPDEHRGTDGTTDERTGEGDREAAKRRRTAGPLAPSRRQFLTTAVAGGLVGGAIASSTSVAAEPPDVAPENLEIYLLFGQSNMEGMGETAPKDREIDPRVHLLADADCPSLDREYGNWYPAEPPLNRCWDGLGPGDYFGKRMAEERPDDVHIGLVPAAISGAEIALFEKGAPIGTSDKNVPQDFPGGYAWLLDLAQRAQEVGTIRGICFHQGESDTGDPQWKYTVQEIVSDLRSDLGIGEVPFLAGEVLYGEYGGCCDAHNPEIRQLPDLIPNAHVVSAEGLGAQDEAHFDAEGYRELGRRYADTMLDALDLDEEAGPCSSAAGGSAEVDGRTVCDVAGDGLYRDVTGDGSVGQTDVVQFFERQHRDAWKQPDRFDFSGNGEVGHGDVVSLFEHVALG